jgi:hypothetical protein
VSRKRWIFLVVTAVSAVAFLVDRFFLSAPAAAVAEGPTRTTKPRPVKPANAASAAVPDPELYDPSLSYLDKLPQSDFNRDIFAASPEMRKFYQQLEEKQNTDPATKGAKPGSLSAFADNHHLQATLDGAIAVVDEKMLRVGQEYKGFKLTRVGPYDAEFTRNQEHITLYIPAPDTKSESDKKSESDDKNPKDTKDKDAKVSEESKDTKDTKSESDAKLDKLIGESH